MLDQSTEVKEIYENGRWPDKDMRKEGRIDFT
jgi:hypothetical protein